MRKQSFGNKELQVDLSNYSRILLCGLVWMGKMVAPIRNFISAYKNEISSLYYLSCCGTSDTVENEKYSHKRVFKQMKEELGDKCVKCIPFPMGLVLPQEQQSNGDAIMKARLNDDNFTGDIKERFDALVSELHRS